MKCPKCGGTLVERHVQGGVVIDVCDGCGGCWLDDGEALRFTPRPKDLAALLAGPLVGGKTAPRPCPRCGGELEMGGLGKAEFIVQRCRKCRGLWLDPGERALLAQIGMPSFSTESARLPVSTWRAVAAGASAPAMTIAAPALPNLGLRAIGVLGALYGMVGLVVIACVELAKVPLENAVFGGGIFILLQYVVGPILMDFFLQLVQSMHWAEPDELPPHLRDFVARLCQDKRLRVPLFGIIEDGAPNAFTYGHVPGNARVIVTRGLLEMLQPDELQAVVAHELGHVKHWDMVVMTIGGLVPILLYYLYRVLIRAKGKQAGNLRLIAVGAYLLYIVSQYVVLFLARTREYHADRFSGDTTRNPNALASALVKVAYGLAGRVPAEAQERARAGTDLRHAVASMGLFDVHSAWEMALASAKTGRTDEQNLLGAMQWDLWNPWAAYFELQSTHPRPAKRLLALSEQAVSFGQDPFVHFDLIRPEGYWDEFFVDLLVRFSPLLLGAAGFGVGIAEFPDVTQALVSRGLKADAPLHILGLTILGFGVGYLFRTWFSYRGEAGGASSVASLLKLIKVSPVRGVACEVRGKVIGRGVPGLLICEDLVMQDETGFLFLDYRQPLRIWEFLFGLFRAGGIIGQEVTVRGWFRRGPMPYVEMLRLTEADGTVHNCYVLLCKWVWGFVLITGGLALTLARFG